MKKKISFVSSLRPQLIDFLLIIALISVQTMLVSTKIPCNWEIGWNGQFFNYLSFGSGGLILDEKPTPKNGRGLECSNLWQIWSDFGYLTHFSFRIALLFCCKHLSLTQNFCSAVLDSRKLLFAKCAMKMTTSVASGHFSSSQGPQGSRSFLIVYNLPAKT